MKLVSSCGTVACFLDAFTVGLDLLLMWRMQCDLTGVATVRRTPHAVLCVPRAVSGA